MIKRAIHIADIAENRQDNQVNKKRRRTTIHNGAVFDAFKRNGTGERRRTILVRFSPQSLR